MFCVNNSQICGWGGDFDIVPLVSTTASQLCHDKLIIWSRRDSHSGGVLRFFLQALVVVLHSHKFDQLSMSCVETPKHSMFRCNFIYMLREYPRDTLDRSDCILYNQFQVCDVVCQRQLMYIVLLSSDFPDRNVLKFSQHIYNFIILGCIHDFEDIAVNFLGVGYENPNLIVKS